MRNQFRYPDASPRVQPGKQIVHGGVVQQKIIDVVSGIIVHPTEKRVLIARRVQGIHLGNMFEFPGGKVNPGESLQAALARELMEELSIEVKCAVKVNEQYVHQNSGQKVRITTFAVLQYDGEVTLDYKVHSQHMWITNLAKFRPLTNSLAHFIPQWFDVFNSLFKGYNVKQV